MDIQGSLGTMTWEIREDCNALATSCCTYTGGCDFQMFTLTRLCAWTEAFRNALRKTKTELSHHENPRNSYNRHVNAS
jgi:hypothetical protein